MASKTGEGFKYYKPSIYVFKILKWVSIILFTIAMIRILIIGSISKLLHSFGQFVYDKVTANKDGYMHDLFPNADKAKAWGNGFDNVFSFDLSHFLIQGLWIIGIILFVYTLLILLRHRNGEHAPMRNDYEAYKLKKDIIDHTSAKRREKEDNDDGSSGGKKKKRKKLKRIERMARKQIRDVHIEIHTRNREDMPNPYKTYVVQFRRLKKSNMNDLMLKKLKGLNEYLTSETEASFSDIEKYGQVYEFRANMQLESRNESFIVKLRRRRKMKETGSDTSSVYAFPLDLFSDNKEEIETQTAKAEGYASKLQQSVAIFLSSKNVYADKSECFTGNTSIRLSYTLPPHISNPPNTEDLEKGLDSSLKLSGTEVVLDGGTLVVTVPLPSAYAIPIDVRSMVEEVF